MDMSQPSEFEKIIKKAIEKTGLPTEMMATKILIDAGWVVNNEFPYIDMENKRVRTLDIKANRSFPKNGESIETIALSPNSLDCELFIECKKSDKPWVFSLDTLTHSRLWLGLGQIILNTIDSRKLTRGEKEISESILNKIPAYLDEEEDSVALSHQILFIKEQKEQNSEKKSNCLQRIEEITIKVEEDNDEIYSAEMQIFKALKHQEEKEKHNDGTYKRKRVILPIILFNGNMFGCFYKNGELKTPKIQYTRHLAHGLPDQKMPALLDVVSMEYFPEYIKRINLALAKMNE